MARLEPHHTRDTGTKCPIGDEPADERLSMATSVAHHRSRPLDPEDPVVLDLLLLGPALAVIGAAVLVVRRERRPVPSAVEVVDAVDPIVDLAFLRASPREIDRRITALRADASGSLGARLRTVQLAQEAQPPGAPRRRRRQPLVASR